MNTKISPREEWLIATAVGQAKQRISNSIFGVGIASLIFTAISFGCVYLQRFACFVCGCTQEFPPISIATIAILAIIFSISLGFLILGVATEA